MNTEMEAPDPRHARLIEALDRLPLPGAPDLKGPVLAELRARKAARGARPNRALWAFALACAAAVPLVLVSRHASPAPSQSAGTMAPQEAAGWPQVARAEGAGAVLTVRGQGDRYAFFLAGTSASLRWDPARWEAVAPGAEPAVLRLRGGEARVSLCVGGQTVGEVTLRPGQ